MAFWASWQSRDFRIGDGQYAELAQSLLFHGNKHIARSFVEGCRFTEGHAGRVGLPSTPCNSMWGDGCFNHPGRLSVVGKFNLTIGSLGLLSPIFSEFGQFSGHSFSTKSIGTIFLGLMGRMAWNLGSEKGCGVKENFRLVSNFSFATILKAAFLSWRSNLIMKKESREI